MPKAAAALARPELEGDVLDVVPAARPLLEDPIARARPELEADVLDVVPAARSLLKDPVAHARPGT